MARSPGVGDKPIVIRISDDLHAALKRRAQDEERPVAQVMRRALRAYLGHHDDASPEASAPRA